MGSLSVAGIAVGSAIFSAFAIVLWAQRRRGKAFAARTPKAATAKVDSMSLASRSAAADRMLLGREFPPQDDQVPKAPNPWAETIVITQLGSNGPPLYSPTDEDEAVLAPRPRPPLPPMH